MSCMLPCRDFFFFLIPHIGYLLGMFYCMSFRYQGDKTVFIHLSNSCVFTNTKLQSTSLRVHLVSQQGIIDLLISVLYIKTFCVHRLLYFQGKFNDSPGILGVQSVGRWRRLLSIYSSSICIRRPSPNSIKFVSFWA